MDWVNAFTWQELGLRELALYTTHQRVDRLMADAPHFPTVVYRSAAMQRDVLSRPAPGVALFAGQGKLGGAAAAPLLQSQFDLAALPVEQMNEETRAARRRILHEPTVALHVRRGDYLSEDLPGWHGATNHYRQAVAHVAADERFATLRGR